MVRALAYLGPFLPPLRKKQVEVELVQQEPDWQSKGDRHPPVVPAVREHHADELPFGGEYRGTDIPGRGKPRFRPDTGRRPEQTIEWPGSPRGRSAGRTPAGPRLRPRDRHQLLEFGRQIVA